MMSDICILVVCYISNLLPY